MPIKFNITKHDVLANGFRQLAQKANGTSFSGYDEILNAQAILVASFSSRHAWQTNRALGDRDVERLRSSQEIRGEYAAAKATRWKTVDPKDLQEVSQMNIPEQLFSIWLAFNTEKDKRETYRTAWVSLNKEFADECDNKERATETSARA